MRFWEWRYSTGLPATHHLFPTELAVSTHFEAAQVTWTACDVFIDTVVPPIGDLPRCSACHRLGPLREQAYELFAKGNLEHPLLWGHTSSGRGIHLGPATVHSFCGRMIINRCDDMRGLRQCVRCLRAADRFLRRFKK